MRDGSDGDGAGLEPRSGDAGTVPAPVASLDELGGAPPPVGPVARFDAERVGADRADVPVADLARAAGHLRRRRGRLTAEMAASAATAAREILEQAERRVAESSARSSAQSSAERPPQPAGGGGTGTGNGARPKRPRQARTDAARGGRGARDLGAADHRVTTDPEADPLAVARAICLNLLTERARSRQELAAALRRKGVPEEAARAVLERFGEVGLIDDAAFAEQWVHSRHSGSKGLGRRALAVELRCKGVADDIAGDALGEIDTAAEERRARELVDRKLRGAALDSPEQRAAFARRLAGMLARKGYGAGVSYRVVREAIAARGAEIDELGSGDEIDD